MNSVTTPIENDLTGYSYYHAWPMASGGFNLNQTNQMKIEITKRETNEFDANPIIEAAVTKASEDAKQTFDILHDKIGKAERQIENVIARIDAHESTPPTQTVLVDVLYDRSVWVTSNPNSCQTGSEVNPISVRNETEFKELLDNYAGQDIYLMKGSYFSYGYCQVLPQNHPHQTVLRPATRIIGIGKPIIHLLPSDDAKGRVVALANAHESIGNGHSSVENVGVNLEAGNGRPNINTEAMLLVGPNSRIESVEIHWPHANVPVPSECFPIFITDGPDRPADNCIIREVTCDTELSCPFDQQFSLVAIAPIYHPMRNPQIRDCRLTVANSPGGNMHNAFSMTGCIGGRVSGNYLEGPLNGFYIDSYSLDGLVIEDNEFHDCRAGVVLVNDCNRVLGFKDGPQQMQNIHIRGNNIRLRQSTNWPDSGIVILGARTPHGAQNTMSNVWCHDNTIWLDKEVNTCGNWGIIAKYGPQQTLPIPGFRQWDNMIHPLLKNSII